MFCHRDNTTKMIIKQAANSQKSTAYLTFLHKLLSIPCVDFYKYYKKTRENGLNGYVGKLSKL